MGSYLGNYLLGPPTLQVGIGVPVVPFGVPLLRLGLDSVNAIGALKRGQGGCTLKPINGKP